jgi:ethanolamine ammonia-lyase small subunit
VLSVDAEDVGDSTVTHHAKVESEDRVGEIVGARRSAAMIGDDAQIVALAGDAQERLDEFATLATEEP